MSETRRDRSLGRICMGLLAVTVVSGAALVPFYRPDRALETVEAIQSGIPWAWWLRALHGMSAIGLFAGGMVHAVDVAVAGTDRNLGPGVWWRSVLILPVLTAAMLGGFLMRGDAEAARALETFHAILASIPLAGPALDTLWLGPLEWGLGVTALHHAGTVTVVLWLLSSEHGGRLMPDLRPVVLAAILAGAAAALVPLPLGPGEADGRVLGPWYLLGLQGALLDLPTWTAWALPLAALILFGVLRHARGAARTGIVVILAAVAAAYVFFTIRLLAWAQGS